LAVWSASFGTLAGSLLPLALRRIGFDASASAPFVATLVDVTGS
jgi:magnesium transporter